MRQASFRSLRSLFAGCWRVLIAAAPTGSSAQVPVGVAVVDITPDYPIRLMGYGSRKTESEGIASRLKARALAIGADRTGRGGPAVLVAVDNCAVGANVDGRSGGTPEEQSRSETRAVRRLLDSHPLRAGARAASWTSSSARRSPPTRKPGSNATPAS